MQPLVSIVIPCYKGERYLAEAIESCQRQTYSYLEILVVDDASPDRCAEIAEQYALSDSRIQVIRRPSNGRVSRAFNTGYEAARGDYMTRLAQDDLFHEEAVAMMLSYLQDHSELGLVYCDMQIIDDQGAPCGHWQTAPPEMALKAGNKVGLCVMWPRRTWEVIGPFSPEFDTAEDYEYWLRIQKQFPIGRCPEVVPFSLRHHAETGTIQFNVQQSYAHARADCLHLPLVNKRAVMAHAHFQASHAYQRQGNSTASWQCAWKSVLLWPVRLLYWKSALGAMLRVLGKKPLPQKQLPESQN